MMNISQRIEEQFYIKKAIMTLGKHNIYFEEFSQQLNILIAYFQSQTPQHWALCLENPFEFTVAFLGLLIAGKTPVLLPNYKAGTQAHFSNEYDVLITSLDTLFLETSHVSTDEISPDQEIVFFTSGSTGKPKKVIRTFKTLLTEIHMLESLFCDVMKNSLVYSTVSHQHIYGLLFSILWPLLWGRTSVMLSLTQMDILEEVLLTKEPVILVTSPTFLSRLNIEKRNKSSAMVFSSGGLLKSQDAQRLYETLNLKPYEILGSTETGGVAFRQQITNPHWKVLPGVSVSQDESSECLWVKSPYFDDKEPFLMGDRVVMHGENTFELLGRQDRIVKVEGKRLSLQELEERVKKHEYIQDAYSVFAEDKRQYVTLAVILNEKGQAQLTKSGKHGLNTAIQHFLSDFYESILIPKKFHYVTHFPLNEQGKLVLEDLLTLCENSL